MFVRAKNADKATLEVFDMPESADLATAVISKHSNPASEIGGDGRLRLPEKNKIQSQDADIDGQVPTRYHTPVGLVCSLNARGQVQNSSAHHCTPDVVCQCCRNTCT